MKKRFCMIYLSIFYGLVLLAPSSGLGQTATSLRGSLPMFADVVRQHANEVWFLSENEAISRWDIWGAVSYINTTTDGEFTLDNNISNEFTSITDGKYTHEEEHQMFQQWIGADFHLTDRIFIGVIGAFEQITSEASIIGSSSREDSDSNLEGGGLALGLRLTDDLIMNVSTIFSNISSDDESNEGQRYLLAASVTQNIFYRSDLNLRLDVTGMYATELYDDDETFEDASAQFGRISVGIEAETTWDTLFNTFVGVRGEYDIQGMEYSFELSGVDNTIYAPEEEFGVGLKGGLIGRLGGLTVRLEAGYGDIFRDSYETFYGKVDAILSWNEYFHTSIAQYYQGDSLAWQARAQVSF